MRGFYYRNIAFEKASKGDGVVVKGEIINSSGRNYHAVVFRITLYVKDSPIANTKLIINGLDNGQTRSFEKQLEDLKYTVIKNKIVNLDVSPENWY